MKKKEPPKIEFKKPDDAFKKSLEAMLASGPKPPVRKKAPTMAAAGL